jgi:hypothetical protein
MTSRTLILKMTTPVESLSVAAQSQIKGGMATIDDEKTKKTTAKI